MFTSLLAVVAGPTKTEWDAIASYEPLLSIPVLMIAAGLGFVIGASISENGALFGLGLLLAGGGLGYILLTPAPVTSEDKALVESKTISWASSTYGVTSGAIAFNPDKNVTTATLKVKGEDGATKVVEAKISFVGESPVLINTATGEELEIIDSSASESEDASPNETQE